MTQVAMLDRLAEVLPEAERLDSLVPALLKLLQGITGLESTYLTRVDFEQGTQTILYANNTDDSRFEIPEGLVVAWDDTLCKRALESSQAVSRQVSEQWG